MHVRAWLVCLLALGCGTAPPPSLPTAAAGPPGSPTTTAPEAKAGELPPDLAIRKGSDWPTFLGPTGDSVSPEKGILSPWPKNGLRVVWQTQLGNGYSMPSVSRGRLFQFDRVGDEARVLARHAETGKELWEFKYPTQYEDMYGYSNGPRCSPVVDGDRVYVLGPEGMLHCLRAADGKLVWKVNTQADFHFMQNFFGVGSTPLIDGDLLIVGVGGSPADQQPVPDLREVKSNGSAVVAFDKLTGKVRYKTGDDLASYASPIIAPLAGRRLGLYFARGGLLAFDPATGKEAFHFPWRARILESVNASNPVVVGDTVLISETYGPGGVALKVKPSGPPEVIWSDEDKGRTKSLQTHWNTPVHHDGYVYASSGRHTSNAELRCVELATGKVRWRVPDLTRASLLKVDGHLVCQCEDGLLLLIRINPNKYEEVSRIEPAKRGGDGLVLEYPAWSAPILARGLLYVRGKDRLYCLELIPQ